MNTERLKEIAETMRALADQIDAALAEAPKPVASGKSDCGHGEGRCGNVSCLEPAPPPKKLPLLPLVVGGLYRTRNGSEAVISSRYATGDYPFHGRDDDLFTTWTAEGRNVLGCENPADLVERIR